MNQEQIDVVNPIDDAATAGIQKGLERLQKMRDGEIPVPAEPDEGGFIEPQEIEEEYVEDAPPEEIGEEDMPAHSPDAVKPDDDIFEEEKSKPKIEKAWKLKKAIHRERSEKFVLKAENDELRKQLAQSLDLGAQYYQKGTLSDLEMAKENKKKAWEAADMDGVMEADLSITRALLSLHELNRLNAQTAPINQQFAPATVEDDEQELHDVHSEIAADWLQSHSYLNKSSPNYDSALAEKVVEYAKATDSALIQQNRSDLIFSEPYFDKINGFIEGVRTANTRRARDLASANHIGGVRGATPVTRRAAVSRLPELNDNEKQMAMNMGISEENWKKRKQQFQQK